MEKLICFQITNTREIERLASNMKIRVIKADASIYNETLDLSLIHIFLDLFPFLLKDIKIAVINISPIHNV